MAPRRFRPKLTLRTSVLAVMAGALLLVGGALLVLAGREDQPGGGRTQAPKPGASAPTTPAKACRAGEAPPNVELPGSDHGGSGPDADATGGMRHSVRALHAAFLATLALAPAANASTEQARPADAFVDSIGVNVHLGYTRSPYRRYDLIQKQLVKLGVRHIRDGLNPGQPFVYEAWRDLASCGIKLDLIVGDPLRRWGIGPLENQLALLKRERLHEGTLASVEGPNEYDVQGDPRWEPVLRDYQERLYRAIKSDPATADIPVLGPTVVRPDNRKALGDMSGYVDYGNMHPYPGGNAPDRDTHLDQELGLAKINSGRKPVQATEVGYHNALNSATPHKGASEQVVGTYMPRLYLDFFRRGIARTYAYELIDQYREDESADINAHWGLLRNDFSEKPGFTAIRRLTTLLRDPGPAFKPGGLSYSLEGASTGVRRLLLQKRDGSFYLALWNEAPVWDATAGRDLHTEPERVRLSFEERASRLELYRPSTSGRALLRRTNVREVVLNVSTGVAIVKVVTSGRKSSGLNRLRGKERRVARALVRLSSVRPASSAARHRARRLARWLSLRSRSIRRGARNRGWQVADRRVRYRAIRTVLRRA